MKKDGAATEGQVGDISVAIWLERLTGRPRARHARDLPAALTALARHLAAPSPADPLDDPRIVRHVLWEAGALDQPSPAVPQPASWHLVDPAGARHELVIRRVPEAWATVVCLIVSPTNGEALEGTWRVVSPSGEAFTLEAQDVRTSRRSRWRGIALAHPLQRMEPSPAPAPPPLCPVRTRALIRAAVHEVVLRATPQSPVAVLAAFDGGSPPPKACRVDRTLFASLAADAAHLLRDQALAEALRAFLARAAAVGADGGLIAVAPNLAPDLVRRVEDLNEATPSVPSPASVPLGADVAVLRRRLYRAWRHIQYIWSVRDAKSFAMISGEAGDHDIAFAGFDSGWYFDPAVVFADRPVAEAWRQGEPVRVRIVADQCEPYANEAEIVVLPGVAVAALPDYHAPFVLYAATDTLPRLMLALEILGRHEPPRGGLPACGGDLVRLLGGCADSMVESLIENSSILSAMRRVAMASSTLPVIPLDPRG